MFFKRHCPLAASLISLIGRTSCQSYSAENSPCIWHIQGLNWGQIAPGRRPSTLQFAWSVRAVLFTASAHICISHKTPPSMHQNQQFSDQKFKNQEHCPSRTPFQCRWDTPAHTSDCCRDLASILDHLKHRAHLI